jgi:hypothetical protein
MRFARPALSGSILAIVVLLIVSLALTQHSIAAVVSPATQPTCSPTVTFCYEIVNYSSSDYNYITGINNSQSLTGAFSSTSGGSYTSFFGTPLTNTQEELSLYSVSDTERDGSLSTYLSSLDDGSSSTAIQVGYIVQSLLSETEGIVRLPGGTWDQVHDPNQTNGGPCNVTEALGVFDERVGVGYYETGNSTPCTKHAFEFYSNGSLSSPYTYVDLTPKAPTSASDVSAVASGINILGDVVGTITWTSGGKSHAAGWIYRDFRYTTFCVSGSTAVTSSACNVTTGASKAYATYANGLDFSDIVVGNYTDPSTGYQHGFAITNPWQVGSKFTTIDTGAPYTNTVLSSDNQATGPDQREFFAGWTWGPTSGGGSAKTSGIVGVCPANHCSGLTSTTGPRSPNRP